MRLSTLAAEAELAVSTVHRLLMTLEQRGFVQQDHKSGHWIIGHRVHSVGKSYSLHDHLVIPGRRFLRDLRDDTRETANLGIVESEEVVIIAQVESREILRAISNPGGRVPVLNSAIGKAVISTWPDRAILNLYKRQGVRRLTQNSLITERDIIEEVGRIRERGYAVDDEEYEVGMRCVSAVIRDRDNEAIAAISVSGVAARVTLDKVPQIAEKVCKKAEELTELVSII